MPRHLFVPDVEVEEAYQGGFSVIKRRSDGTPVSTAAAPGPMAVVLEQLDLKPGQHVLEIGAGSGYGAALLADIVGPKGRVVTIEIDDDIAEAARRHLRSAGFPMVQVVSADGVFGYAAGAPYDRVVLTTASPDIAGAWVDQLSPPGRLVIPLWVGGIVKSVAFERSEHGLTSVSMSNASFTSFRGPFGGTAGDLQLNMVDDPEGVVVHFTRLGIRAALAWSKRDR